MIVRYKSEIDPVLELAKHIFDRGEPENKLDRLEPNTFGYLSVHADIRLRADDPLGATYSPSRFRAEMQVRTLAQHLWAEMAHDSVYNSEESLRPANKLLQRRIYILAGVVELADEEFNRIEHEMPTVPEFRVLKSLTELLQADSPPRRHGIIAGCHSTSTAPLSDGPRSSRCAFGPSIF